jgi:hypothetical protein
MNLKGTGWKKQNIRHKLRLFSSDDEDALAPTEKRQYRWKSLDERVAAKEIENCLLITHNGLTSMKCHLEVIHITM